MAYREEPSLEELIAGSINKKKSAKRNVIKATVKEQTKSFRLDIDYSKSDSSFYEKELGEENFNRSEFRNARNRPSEISNTSSLDPEFLKSLRENFGTNAAGSKKKKVRKKEISIEIPDDNYYDGYGDYDGYEEYDGYGEEYAPENVSQRSGKTVKASVKKICAEPRSAYKKPSEENVKKKKTDRTVSGKQKETTKMNTEQKKKKSIAPKIFAAFLVLILLLGAVVYMFISKYAGLFNYVPTGDRLDIENVFSDKSTMNILLIGTDSRGSGNGLSDSMILVSINKDTKEIVMSSFMRDNYVQIPGQETEMWHKLNWAHSHGGAELLMDTLEFNFGIEIDNYAKVDFTAFAEIIDAVGGLDITITDAEANAMIKPMAEQNNIFGNEKGTDYLYEGGTYHMNGNQALAYSRIRKGVGDDFARTDRQREVIGLVADKAKNMSVSELDDLAEVILPNITTNMEKKAVMQLIAKAPVLLGYDRISQRVPYGDKKESWSYGTSADGSIIVPDFELNKKRLMETIYHKIEDF